MKTTKEACVIWDYDIDLEDYWDYLEDEYPDVKDEAEMYRICEEDNDSALECERMNLDIELGRDIIAIGDLGLWNGRVQGYNDKIGTNVSDCLSFDHTSDCRCKWYIDTLGDLRCVDIHHDGTNYYVYRVFKEGISEEQKENFLYKMWQNKATRRDITRYTDRVGKYIADVYGIKVRENKRKKAV